MRSLLNPVVGAVVVLIQLTGATKTPVIQTLPGLREQAKIVDAWTAEREALIPDILRKYNVDAWLVRLSSSPLPPKARLQYDSS